MTTPHSRILVCERVINTTLGDSTFQQAGLSSAPSPLPSNYGYFARWNHQVDLAMMGIINGIERTPGQFRKLVEEAGLRIEKIWECRSLSSIVECRAVFPANGEGEGGKIKGLEGN